MRILFDLIVKSEEIRRQEVVKMRHATRKAEIEEVQLKEFENFTKEYVRQGKREEGEEEEEEEGDGEEEGEGEEEGRASYSLFVFLI